MPRLQVYQLLNRVLTALSLHKLSLELVLNWCIHMFNHWCFRDDTRSSQFPTVQHYHFIANLEPWLLSPCQIVILI